MSLSLTNRDDIIANSFSIITSNGLVVDVLDAASARVSGLAPETLNTITKISGALDNDPLIFQKIKAKQEKQFMETLLREVNRYYHLQQQN